MPELEPLVGAEKTDYGWRGLTAEGEVLEVRSEEGKPPSIPESVTVVANDGIVLGRRAVPPEVTDVASYLGHFEAARQLHRMGRDEEALAELDMAVAIAPTARARYNRAFVLLALGRWIEGFGEYEACERHKPFARPKSLEAAAAGVKPWRGEGVSGKRLLLVHDHGFGDTIMMLRYVSVLKMAGADVVIWVPPELARVASQFAEVTTGLVKADLYVSVLHLMRWLEVVPESVPTGPYVEVDPNLKAKWHERIGGSRLPRIGVAWSVGVEYDGDYPRAVSLVDLVAKYAPGAELHSVQTNDRATADFLGVANYAFEDFADCAALMSLMDQVVSVDTAAVHLAGAIGHPRVTVLLSRWRSWRWRNNPFYPMTKIVESGR